MPFARYRHAPLFAAAIAVLALVVPGARGAQTSVGAGALPAAASATGPTGAPVSAALSASLSACHSDPVAANRYAIFASQMLSISGTNTMSVNFQLQERSPGAVAFGPVSAPGFGVWVSSQPGVGIYTYNHEVTALPAPAAFRVLVHARWLDRHRHVIRREGRISAICVQPLAAPNLAIGVLTRGPGAQPGTVTYSVVVRNDGTAAALPFQVSLSLGGVALPSSTVAGLAAGAKQIVVFTGGRCVAGSILTASADSGGALSEPANPNRTKTFPCTR